MAVNKNFVVKNGLEVNEDLIFASSDLDKVGIGSTIPTTTLDVKGQGIAAEDAKFTGIGTVINQFNVGTGGTAFRVLGGPTVYPYVGINTGTPLYPAHILNANPGIANTFNPTLYVEGDVDIRGRKSNITGGGGDIKANSIVLGNQRQEVGFVSTYNLNVTGISTYALLAWFKEDVDAGRIIVSGFSTFSNASCDGLAATTVSVSAELNVTGVSTFKNDVHLLDSDILEFGGAEHETGDLQIYHDSSNSYIKERGTGNLYVDSTAGSINLRVNTSESAIVAQQDSSVDLYFNNTRKFSTVGTGVSIVGIATASGGFEGYAGFTTIAPSGGITTVGSSDLFLYGSQTVYSTVGNGVTVVGLTSTKHLHVTGISSIVTLDVGSVTSGLVVSGGSTIAGISSINTIHVGNGGTTFTVTGDGTFAIGSATTTVAATLNGGSIPSIGLVIALGG